MATITTEPHSRHRQARWLGYTMAGAACVLPCLPASAAEWKFTPTVDIRETYTDNVRLLPADQAKADYVTELLPGVTITEKSRRLSFDLNWTFDSISYARKNNSGHTANLGHVQLASELIDEHLFVNANGSVSQQSVSPFGPQSTSLVNGNDNRTEVRNYGANVAWRDKFGQWASSEARAAYDAVSSSTPGFTSSKADTLTLDVKSGQAFRRFTWGLNVNDQKVHYKNADTVGQLSETFNGRLSLIPEWALIGSVGYERNDYVAIGDTEPAGRFYTLGLSWTPSERSKLEASVGHHYYGRTFSLTGNHRSRHTVWTINYSDSVTSTRGQFLVPPTIDTAAYLNQLYAGSISDTAARQQTVSSIISQLDLPSATAQPLNFLSNRYFLQKSLQASVALNSAKTTSLISVFDTRREALSQGTVDDLLFGGGLVNTNNTQQLGVSAQWNWHYSDQTQFNVIGQATRTYTPDIDRKDLNKSLRVNMTRQFRPQVRGIVELRRVLGESTQQSAEYRENAIAASLNLQL